MNKDFLLKLNLQHFADEGEGTVEETSTGETEFKAPTSQAELDSIIGKAVNTALSNANKNKEAEIQKAIQAELDKQKEYAKLSADEIAKKEFQSERERFEQELKEFNHNKLVMQVKEDLVTKGLPTVFAELFAMHDDAEKALESVNQFKVAFEKAVNEKVKETARQSAPLVGGGVSKTVNYGTNLAGKTQSVNKKPF